MWKLIVGVVAALALAGGAAAQENYESWRLHTPTFGSTGGNGVIIGEYRPVIAGDKCTTDSANGTIPYRVFVKDGVMRGNP